MPVRGLYGRQIFDAKGVPTVEVDLLTELGVFRASVPSAKTVAANEAVELRDEDNQDYHGTSVFKAVDNVNEIIAQELATCDLEVTDQAEIDQLLLQLDGTETKSHLGVNAILAVSMAVAKAGAARRGLPLYQHIADLAGNKTITLPIPTFNLIDGGHHARNKLAFREIMAMPTGASSFTEAMKMGTEVYHKLKQLLQEKVGGQAIAVGDGGGFAPNIDAADSLKWINEAITAADYVKQIEIALDVDAHRFFKNGVYDMDFKNAKSDKKKWLKPEQLTTNYEKYIKDYPVVYIEDPYDKEHLEFWTNLKNFNRKVLVVADYITVSNPKYVQEVSNKDVCNSLVLKLSQVGTVTEAIQAHLLAKANSWTTVVSSRSGDTEDTFIADLAVGLSANQIKAGAPCRSECVEKYNQILRIEEELGPTVTYAGDGFRRTPWVKYVDAKTEEKD